MLPNSLHARPATHLCAFANRFPAEVTLINERTGVAANAKSVLALISADILTGDPLLLRVRGSGEEAAFADLTRFLRDDFLATDEPLPAPPPPDARPLPRSLRAAAPEQILRGAILGRGIAQGVIKRAQGLQPAEALLGRLAAQKVGSAAAEQARYDQAVKAVNHGLEKEIAGARGEKKEILRAHAALLNDVTFAETVARELAGGTAPIAHALLAAIRQFRATLEQSTSVYLRERVLDLTDIGGRLLREIYGADAVVSGPALDAPSVVIAEELTPGQFLALDPEYLRGLVLQHAGATSHTAILARAAGLPILTAVEGATALPEGIDAILDANLGILLPAPNEATRRYYMLEERRTGRALARWRIFITKPGASSDGHLLPVLANVSSAAEVSRAVAEGAEGIGLFRTEMLFMDRDTPPSEEEQCEVYTAAVRAAHGRPVTLRTFDIGGDKPVPYLHLAAEANPFLGNRGARIYGQFAGLLTTQLRAMIRSAAHGPVRIMAPMIAVPEEMRAFRRAVEEVRSNFSAPGVLVGMMLEIPSAAFAIAEFARDADFFSVGTNDLCQYFFAADRDNASVASLSQGLHPAFLRLLRHIVTEAHENEKPVGLCGELAEGADALPALLGLELDSISLGAHRILATKAELAAVDFPSCRSYLDALLNHGEGGAAPHRQGRPRQSLLALELVETNSPSSTKHEAIKELTDLLAAADRTGDPAAIEEAVWLREEAYSTGFGHGFAVPHCQSDHVLTSSIAVLRLREPVDWGALDGQPVRMVLMLALRAEEKGREHLRIFAKLSRLVMNEEFRTRLEQAPDAPALYSVLETELNPTLVTQ
jgi:fructose-specific PTS system IIA-like component